MTPTKIAFEQRYSDDSGVEFGVRYDASAVTQELEVESIHTIRFPIGKLRWLIDALTAVAEIVEASEPSLRHTDSKAK